MSSSPMPTQQSTVDFLIDQLSSAGNIRSRKMFGEYVIYCNDKVVALVCDDNLFIKPTTGGRAFIKKVIEKPPYPSAKLYFWISSDHWDDDEWLGELVKITAKEVLVPKKKREHYPTYQASKKIEKSYKQALRERDVATTVCDIDTLLSEE